ncbi:hypothetical protein [Sphingosinicella sp.]|uniref:hypothetical protein n=1 Tax=Sphingosinicella sp. TaxID=1917971 RepID=UPI0040379505
MVIILAAFLGGQVVLTEIDRRALDTQARAEARQPRRAATAPVVRAPVRQPVARRTSTSGLDFAQTTTICRASGNQTNPALFLSRISTAYSLSPGEATALRSSCAAYIAGRNDARRNGNN